MFIESEWAVGFRCGGRNNGCEEKSNQEEDDEASGKAKELVTQASEATLAKDSRE